MEEKKEFILHWKSGKYTITNLADMFNISRPTAYKYIQKYEEYGMSGQLDDERGPRFPHNKTPDHLEKKLIAIKKKYPRWGAKKLIELLAEKYPDDPNLKLSTANLILKRNGLVKTRKRRFKVKPKYPIFDPDESNLVWSADFKGQFKLGNKKYCYPLTIADSYSRYIFSAKGMYNPNRTNSQTEFRRIFRIYGIPKQLHTDNGQPFASFRALGRISRLSAWFMELGIQPVFSDPGKPQQNGRHERMHQDLKAAVTIPPSGTLQPQQRRLNSYIKEYNQIRPHEALNMKTPEAVHIYSDRKYPEKIKDWYYPSDYIVRRVTNNGAIRIGRTNGYLYLHLLQVKNLDLRMLETEYIKCILDNFFLVMSI